MLAGYEVTERNKPEEDGTSRMSPYLHYGHIGPQTIALAVDAAAKADPALKAGAGQLLQRADRVARADDQLRARTSRTTTMPSARRSGRRRTIAEHARDEREHLYTLEQMERGGDLRRAVECGADADGAAWMDAQLHADVLGQEDPGVDAGCEATAFEYCVYLNDRYFLDGRDPNGYGGIAWAIVGKFDRAVGVAAGVWEDPVYVGGVDRDGSLIRSGTSGRCSALP